MGFQKPKQPPTDKYGDIPSAYDLTRKRICPTCNVCCGRTCPRCKTDAYGKRVTP